MKIFQIKQNIVHYDMSHLYSSIEVARSKYPATTQIVEAPDYVFEGWGFNPNEEGDNRFIKPTAPEGWEYDDTTGTFYNPGLLIENKIANLRTQISLTDPKVLECYECTCLGIELPYNMEKLHAERKELRDKITELEAQLPVAPEDPGAANKYGITDKLLTQIKDDTLTEIEEAVINGTY